MVLNERWNIAGLFFQEFFAAKRDDRGADSVPIV
jgi:hypothetical protein